MNILVVSQYFWPETFIINELVKCLTDHGHYIEVVTGKPNYPEGEVFAGYSAAGCITESFETIKVHRIPIYPRGKGAKKLILNYLSYIFSGLFYFPHFLKGKQFDAILVFVPSPITSVIPAMYLKRRLRSHLAVWVQDLWPESVKATGFIQNGMVLKMIGWVVKWIYKASDTLLVQSQAFTGMMEKYTHPDKLVYYPNSFFDPPPNLDKTATVPESLTRELKENRCFVFAGNLGTAQALDTLMQAAEKLQHLPECKIILIGSGSQTDFLKKHIAEKNLKNVLLPGRFPPSLMPEIFSLATGLLVTLKDEEIFSYTIPSKIQAYLAAGRPILAALNGEGARIVLEAGAGLVSPAEDSAALAKNMEQLYHMTPSEREKLGKAGRSYFLEHFEMKKQSQRLIEILSSRITEKRRKPQ
ncbi:glycosyltransferase family 4 protein [Fluoribacter dumoffii]|uniref:Putative glycosyl transferase n=1 Tax=Fluoribacter dumoffii TaxID=463 RepID=A0A377G5S6_9GAMM|nr:glycosyltransferase family 4 protein [Fluoribacter dumoffii]KTC91667.1 glycosyltransferase, group 1 family [Fluoribacter dumoffii NY 23]MCW8387208.1 glycosyltransferase family 4 protein [Fluoribacter dumoffii]MCW8417287.1 glycosyltransferase family 4 protein [Fluoribacter dumoffii]MCW8454872.1 glycosyltransferase family 4 protein [Fluoribacter dumoffii]MCW8461051.1 glycosyltransferase family 4 protein [Fluoribacter dumoffii]